MTKKIGLIFSVISLIIFTICNLNLNLDLNKNVCMQFAQIEALAAGETIPPVDIICDTGGWGKCYETIGSNPISYSCRYTGYQSDYCAWEHN